MALSLTQPKEKERIALVIMGILAILCVGFGVISNASKQKEVGKRVELESKLDQLAQDNGKLQKELNQAKARLDEEVRLNQTLNESLGKEQESAQALRSELEKINQVWN
jgi:Skp family chaperone for outer membrane proteins